MSKFVEDIKNSIIEREVEDVYNKGINLYFPDVNITHPFACDGLLETKTENKKILKLIIEYKLNELFSSKVIRAKVITQVIFYIKQFELNGLQLPNVCMVGDKNECFVFHTNDIIKYLDEDINWNVAPSNSHKIHPELVMKISEDENINPFIFEINKDFSFSVVIDKIRDLANNIQRYVHITEHNIATIYDTFLNRVIKNQKKLTSHSLVSIFMGVITNSENYYQHPNKKNILVTPNGEITIDGDSFKNFFSYFQRVYTPQEKNKFTEIADRLIEDTDRRRSGDFWTPTMWVDYAHERMNETFGENWKDEFVVWDNSCGSKNITRDYRFKELYCSTLYQEELEIGNRYNKEAISFQFDFLNDDLDKIPQQLMNCLLENKPIIFFMNPPYATAGIKGTESKIGCAKTKINEEMLNDGYGACSQNLYAQFLYRIEKIKQQYNLTNCNICLFSPTLFLTGGSYKSFRSQFLKEFNYNNGFQFKASHFSDVANNWGISFTIFNSGETLNKDNFPIDIVDMSNETIEVISKKILYNTDNLEMASSWIKCNEKATEDIPHLSSGVMVKGSTGKGIKNSLGYFFSNGTNNIDSNMQGVAIFSTVYSDGHGQNINKNNFTKCASLFAARKLIEKNWINSKDEYLTPNQQHEKYREFELDSIIYSLFNTSSNQSSLRNIDYNEKKWDIKNEFFFMGKQEMLNLANENNNDECYNDCYTDSNRYVYNYIQEHKEEFSIEAMQILNQAIILVNKSFKYRKLFNEEFPNYQIDNWDASWYQVKGLLKEYMPNELKEFNELYKKFANKLRPMVYELGFLR